MLFQDVESQGTKSFLLKFIKFSVSLKNKRQQITAVLVVSVNIPELEDGVEGGRGASSRSLFLSFPFCFCFLSFFFLISCEADGVNVLVVDKSLKGDSDECFFDLYFKM